MKEGDHVYVLGKEADTVATGTAVDNDRIQVAIETAPGTRRVVRRMYECLAEKDFACTPMLGALPARTELWRSGLGPVLLAALDNRSTAEITLNADGRLWPERLGCPMREIGSMDSRQAEALIRCVVAAPFDP